LSKEIFFCKAGGRDATELEGGERERERERERRNILPKKRRRGHADLKYQKLEKKMKFKRRNCVEQHGVALFRERESKGEHSTFINRIFV